MPEDVTIRAATADDARFYWDVNNDPSVRTQSIDTRPIPFDIHEAWFAASLESPTRRLFVAEAVDGAAGVVRFDVDGTEATISVALSPDYRGRGLGVATIRRGCEEIAARMGLRRVIALVRPDNGPSLGAFERAGFVTQPGTVTESGVELNRMTWEPSDEHP